MYLQYYAKLDYIHWLATTKSIAVNHVIINLDDCSTTWIKLNYFFLKINVLVEHFSD